MSNVECQKIAGKVNVIVTSPPYFAREIYFGEQSSHVKYDTYEKWNHNFLKLFALQLAALSCEGGFAWITVRTTLSIEKRKGEKVCTTIPFGEDTQKAFIDASYQLRQSVPYNSNATNPSGEITYIFQKNARLIREPSSSSGGGSSYQESSTVHSSISAGNWLPARTTAASTSSSRYSSDGSKIVEISKSVNEKLNAGIQKKRKNEQQIADGTAVSFNASSSSSLSASSSSASSASSSSTSSGSSSIGSSSGAATQDHSTSSAPKKLKPTLVATSIAKQSKAQRATIAKAKKEIKRAKMRAEIVEKNRKNALPLPEMFPVTQSSTAGKTASHSVFFNSPVTSSSSAAAATTGATETLPTPIDVSASSSSASTPIRIAAFGGGFFQQEGSGAGSNALTRDCTPPPSKQPRN